MTKVTAQILTESYLTKMQGGEFYLITQLLVGLAKDGKASISDFKELLQPWKWADIKFHVFSKDGPVKTIDDPTVDYTLIASKSLLAVEKDHSPVAALAKHCTQKIENYVSQDDVFLLNNDEDGKCWRNTQAELARISPEVFQTLNLKFVFELTEPTFSHLSKITKADGQVIDRSIYVAPSFTADGTLRVPKMTDGDKAVKYYNREEIDGKFIDTLNENVICLAAPSEHIDKVYDQSGQRKIDPFYNYSWTTPQDGFDKALSANSHFLDEPLAAGERLLLHNASLMQHGAALFADYVQNLPAYGQDDVLAAKAQTKGVVDVVEQLWRFDLNVQEKNKWFDFAWLWSKIASWSEQPDEAKRPTADNIKRQIRSLAGRDDNFFRKIVRSGQYPGLQSLKQGAATTNMIACAKEIATLTETLLQDNTIIDFFNEAIDFANGHNKDWKIKKIEDPETSAEGRERAADLIDGLEKWRVFAKVIPLQNGKGALKNHSLFEIFRGAKNNYAQTRVVQTESQTIRKNMGEAGRAIVHLINRLAQGVAANNKGSFAEYVSPADAVEKRLIDKYIEADLARARLNAGAGAPPQIIIPVDSEYIEYGDLSDAESNPLGVQADIEEDGSEFTDLAAQDSQPFNLNDMLDGYGLIARRKGGGKFIPHNIGKISILYPSDTAPEINPETIENAVIALAPYDEDLPGFETRRSLAHYSGGPAMGFYTADSLEILGLTITTTASLPFYDTHKLPPLAANLEAEIGCYWIGPAGILPPDLRYSSVLKDKNIFKINAAELPEELPKIGLDNPFTHEIKLQRRTAVQSPTLNPKKSQSEDYETSLDHPKNWAKNPENVTPLWESVMPYLAKRKGLSHKETKPAAVLLSNSNNLSDRRSSLEFELGVPGVSFEEWKFWTLAERYKQKGHRVNLATLTKRLEIMMLNQASNTVAPRLPDPAIFQFQSKITDGEDFVTIKYNSTLIVTVKQVIASPTTRLDQRYDFKPAPLFSKECAFSFNHETKEGLIDEISDLQPIKFKISRGQKAVFDYKKIDKEISVTLPSTVTDGQTNLFTIEYQWKIKNKEWFSDVSKYQEIEDHMAGKARKIMVEVAPDDIVDNWIDQKALWDAIHLEQNQTGADRRAPQEANSDSYWVCANFRAGTANFSQDPFSRIGTLDAVYQSWKWDGQPPSILPLKGPALPAGSLASKIIAEPEKAGSIDINDRFVPPSPHWEDIGFKDRGPAGVKFADNKFGNLQKTKLGLITRTRKQRADYYRLKFEARHRYHGLIDGVKTISSKRSVIEPEYKETVDLQPWRGFTVKAQLGPNYKSAAPHIRWAVPSFYSPDEDVEAGGIIIQMDEPIYSENTGHNLAENYQVEVLDYSPPDGGASYPLIGHDPIVRGDVMNTSLGKSPIGDKIILPLEIYRHSVGLSLNAEKLYPNTTGSAFIIKPHYKFKGEEFAIEPFTMAKIRIRRAPFKEGCSVSVAPAVTDRPIQEWSEPYWVQFPATLRQFCSAPGNLENLTLTSDLRIDHTNSRITSYNTLENKWENKEIRSENYNNIEFYIAAFRSGLEADKRTRQTQLIEVSILSSDMSFNFLGDIPQDGFVKIFLVQKRPGAADLPIDESVNIDELFGFQQNPEDLKEFGPDRRVIAVSEAIKAK